MHCIENYRETEVIVCNVYYLFHSLKSAKWLLGPNIGLSFLYKKYFSNLEFEYCPEKWRGGKFVKFAVYDNLFARVMETSCLCTSSFTPVECLFFDYL